MLRAFIAFLITGLFPVFAFAGYAQLVPPPAFQSVGGVSTMNVGTAANGARYAGGHVIANASLNLGARTVTVPVAMRVAANAATFAVTKLNPWIAGLQLATLAIPFIIDWFKGTNLEVSSDGFIRVRGEPAQVSPGDRWVIRNGNIYNLADLSLSDSVTSCMAGIGEKYWGAVQCTTGQMLGYGPGCGSNYVSRIPWCGAPATPVGTPPRPATESDLAQLVNSPINPQALSELGIPLPVDPEPVVNPVSEPVGDIEIGPNGNPAPQLAPNPNPLRYPNGNPVPIPNTNPQTYSQPWWEVSGSPAPDQPWRVIVTPTTTETLDPTPQPDPDGTTPEPEPPFDFYTDCDKFPGSVGCAAVGSPPDVETMPEETRTIGAISGPSFSGEGCPSNLNIAFAGHSFQIVDMSIPCGWISGLVKPIFILLSFITAVFIVRSAL